MIMSDSDSDNDGGMARTAENDKAQPIPSRLTSVDANNPPLHNSTTDADKDTSPCRKSVTPGRGCVVSEALLQQNEESRPVGLSDAAADRVTVRLADGSSMRLLLPLAAKHPLLAGAFEVLAAASAVPPEVHAALLRAYYAHPGEQSYARRDAQGLGFFFNILTLNKSNVR